MYAPRRRTSFKRRSPYRRTLRRRTPIRRTMVRTAQRVINYNLEKKYIDTAYSGGLDSTGVLTAVTASSVGTGDQSARVGDKIKALSLKIKWQFITNINVSTSFIRVIWFQWHPDSSVTAPTVGDILQPAPSYTSFYNHDKGSLFSIFSDCTYTLQTQGRTNVSVNKTFRFGSKLGKMKFVKPIVKYTTGSGSGCDQIYCLIISDRSANTPTIQGTSRLSYTDA